MGEHDAARPELEAALQLARRHGLRELVTWHWFMLGHALYPTGDREAVLACCGNAAWRRQATFRTGGPPGASAFSTSTRGSRSRPSSGSRPAGGG